MLLDYLLVPLICTIYGALTIQRLVPQVPYVIWAALFAALITVINLRGIRATAAANLIMMIVMMAVVLVFIVMATRWLFHAQGWPGLLSTRPFYDPRTFTWKNIATGTSVAALTYGGFDGVSTLSEDVDNPRRNILIATVFVCFFTGIFGGLQIYLAQRVFPDFHGLQNVETAFMDVTASWAAACSSGRWPLSSSSPMSVRGSPHKPASRACFFPWEEIRCCLAASLRISTKSGIRPSTAFFSSGSSHSLERSCSTTSAAELINFGAFLAFMGVNAAVVRQFYFLRRHAERNLLADALLPALGFLFCLGHLAQPTDDGKAARCCLVRRRHSL